MKQLLNIITAVSRPENLAIIGRHLRQRLPSFRVRWYCCADSSRVPAKKPDGLICHWWGAVNVSDQAGGVQRNAALEHIRSGLVLFLDDDNTIHPTFDAALVQLLNEAPRRILYVLGQQEQNGQLLREARPDSVKIGEIDLGQIVLRWGSQTELLRFTQDVYISDWLLVEELLLQLGDDWTSRAAFGPPATFYNALRPEGFDWPDWLSNNVPVLAAHLSPLKDRPARGLEIGSWEGRSARWFLEHVLVHPESRLTCVEPFLGGHEFTFPPESRTHEGRLIGLEERLLVNLRPWYQLPQPKVDLHDACSFEALRGLDLQSYDFAYIDGSHRARDVLEDLVLTYRLLKPGGLLIADDYEWTLSADRPAPAIDAFLSLYKSEIEILHKEYCVVVRV